VICVIIHHCNRKKIVAFQNLLGHPLCMALVRHKWNTFGRYVYYTNLLLYVVFLLALSDYCILTPAPYSAKNIAKRSERNKSVSNERYSEIWGKCLKDQLWISITYYRLISINNHNLCNSLEFNEMSLENNTSHWLQAHNYSSGESCDSFKTFLNEQQYILKQDVRALAGKWIVVILAVFHLLKECFQLANVSTKILST